MNVIERSSEHCTETALLARADLLLLLADLLRSPAPGAWPRQPLPEESSVKDVLEAADLGSNIGDLSRWIDAALIEARHVPHAALSDEHHRLFEGAMHCPLNETAYIRRDKGAILGDIAGFYRAFGFAADSRSGEKPDHLLCEIEFVAALLVMLAQGENADDREIAASALDAFATSHLGDWLPLVCQRLSEITILPMFQHTAAALRELWERLIHVHGWRIAPSATATAAIEPEPESPYECGAAITDELVKLRSGNREF